MTQDEPRVACSSCGAVLPRSDMFGVEPELHCPRCASGIRSRMQVRVRPRMPNRAPAVTIAILALSSVLYLLEHVVYATVQNQPLWFNHLLYLHLHAGPQLWSGELWSLWSTAFMHADFIHILFNMWWAWELGRAVELGFGRLTLVLVILGCAPVATGLEWMVNGPGVGFSGCVYGLAGFLFAHRKTNPYAAAIMNPRTAQFLGIWFVLCIALTLSGTWRIANWAHGGGALWGYLAGLALLDRKRRLWVPLTALLTALFIAAIPFVALGRQAEARTQDARLVEQGANGIERLNRYLEFRYRDP